MREFGPEADGAQLNSADVRCLRRRRRVRRQLASQTFLFVFSLGRAGQNVQRRRSVIACSSIPIAAVVMLKQWNSDERNTHDDDDGSGALTGRAGA